MLCTLIVYVNIIAFGSGSREESFKSWNIFFIPERNNLFSSLNFLLPEKGLFSEQNLVIG